MRAFEATRMGLRFRRSIIGIAQYNRYQNGPHRSQKRRVHDWLLDQNQAVIVLLACFVLHYLDGKIVCPYGSVNVDAAGLHGWPAAPRMIALLDVAFPA
jgi:hypothetical protein